MKAIVRETYGPPDVLHLEDVPNSRSSATTSPALSANGTYVMTGGSNRQLTDVLLFGPFAVDGASKVGKPVDEANPG
jgi:hypothetical protein